MCCISHPKESKKNAVHTVLVSAPAAEELCMEAASKEPSAAAGLLRCSSPNPRKSPQIAHFLQACHLLTSNIFTALLQIFLPFPPWTPLFAGPGTVHPWDTLNPPWGAYLWPLQGFLSQSWLGVSFPRMDCLLRMFLFVVVRVVRKEKNPNSSRWG